MRKSFLGLVFLLGGISRALASDIEAASSVSKVVVYQDRALVTRVAEIELEEGANSVIFSGLPSGLLEESLGVDGQGTASVVIQGVELRRTFAPEEANPRSAQILAELEKLQDEARQLQEKASALQDQRSFIDSIRNFSSVQLPKDIVTQSPKPSEWAELSKFIADSYSQIAALALTNEKAMRDKNKEIQAKQSEYDAMSGRQDREKKTAVVTLEARQKSRFKIELHYLAPQATWALSYDAKVYPGKNSCTLVSYGNVRQWTGEDWNNASLALSSAMPSIGGKMPELLPWFLDFPQVYAPMARASSSLKRGAMAESDHVVNLAQEYAVPLGVAAMAAPAEIAQADVSQELGSVTFEIAKAVTVQSDNQFHKFPVKTEMFPLALDYEATPKLSPYAFIHSKITNDKDYPLPGGEMSVYVDDNYIGKSFIETVGRNETFDVYLGIDQEIKIKRTELVDKRKKALLGLRTRKDFAYKFELENYKKETIQLTVLDQIPVSKNAEIKAELVSSSVKPSETKDLGILKWKFELKPKEKKEFEYQFFAEYPADKIVPNV